MGYTAAMGLKGGHIVDRFARAARSLRAWMQRPFDGVFRDIVPAVLWGAVCGVCPPWLGPFLFMPVAVPLACKIVRTLRRIHALEFVSLVGVPGKEELATKPDRLQRAWALSGVAALGGVFAMLAVRVAMAALSYANVPQDIMLYAAFVLVLIGGFLLFYVLALRFGGVLLRGLASVSVTLPAFFIIVMVVSVALSYVMLVVESWGLSAESMLSSGFAWLYQVQRLLGIATDYFLRQDSATIVISVVLAALLLLLYTASVPHYWMNSVMWWLKGMGLVAVVFSGAALVFAGTWVGSLQEWAGTMQESVFASAVDTGVLDLQARTLGDYQADDLATLAKALVLPYTVGVVFANAVLALRRSKETERADAILNSLARNGHAESQDLSDLRKQYLYYGGNRVLWDVVLRSVGHDIPLPDPVVPRKLTMKERLTGVLEATERNRED